MGTPISGRNGKVMYGSVIISTQTDWSISGYGQAVEETKEFGVTVKKYVAVDAGDPGTISFNGVYDPSDSTGQQALQTLAQTGVGTANLYLYANTSTFWRVAAGGLIIVTKSETISLNRSSLAKISFTGQVSGAWMEQVGTGT
jgi:hypothetical protein